MESSDLFLRFCSFCRLVIISISALTTLGSQFSPIKIVLEGPLAEVGVHGPSLEPEINGRAEVQPRREAPERHAQELPVLREEALAVDDSASDDVVFLEGRAVRLKTGIADFLAAVSGVSVGVLSPARQPERPTG